MPTISPQLVTFLKALGMVAIIAILTYLSDASHFNGFVGPGVGAILAIVASTLETHLKQGTDTALFGTVKVSCTPS